LAYRSAGSIPEPWDVRCRWNFMAIGRDCPLLRTYWKSVNYQWKEGKIVFFAEDPEAQAVQGVTCPDRVISSKAVVIHGCKDGSLHRMAIAGFPIPSDSTGLSDEAKALFDSCEPWTPEKAAQLEKAAADIPSNSMGLDELSGNSRQLEGRGQAVPDLVQNVNNDAQKLTVKRKNKSPSKAKKRRNLSPEERQRRSKAMKAILARKAERKAQGIV
jgi:hypothetical protein